MSFTNGPEVSSPDQQTTEFISASEVPPPPGHVSRASEGQTSVRFRQATGQGRNKRDTSETLDDPDDPRNTTRANGNGPPRRTTVMERIQSVVSSNIKNEKSEKRPEPTDWESLKAVFFASWLNVLLVCIPVSWALHFVLPDTHTNDTVIFVFSFLAIIPLAKLLAWMTEELAERVGQTLGGLMNATLGNVVELIVGIIALVQCKIKVVQSSLVGSILSNLLLVLGMCFFAGGVRYAEQGFIQSSAQLNVSLLVLSVTAILIPAAFHVGITNLDSQRNSTDTGVNSPVDPDQAEDVLKMSRGVAFILLFIYICSMIYQLWSHTFILNESPDSSKKYPPRDPNANRHLKKLKQKLPFTRKPVEHDVEKASDPTDSPSASAENESAEEELDSHKVNIRIAIVMLIVVTVLVAVTAEFLVDSIDGLTADGGISEEWVGLILLPIVGNAAEHVTAVTVSIKDKLDLSIGVAVGSSIQIALFVVPVLVILGWILGKPLSLLFDPFESIVLFLSVLVVAFCIGDGRSNWLEGMILMMLYIILALAFWFYPGASDTCAVQL